MKYVYKWWSEFEEYGETIKEEKYFSSRAKVKLYSADHAAVNDWDSSYASDYEQIELTQYWSK